MKYVAPEKVVKTKHEKLGDIEVNVEVPQCESIEEFVTFCGGEANALAYANSAIETAAKNGVRTGGRAAAADITKEALVEKLQKLAKDYSPSTAGRGASVKAKAAKFDAVEELVKSGKEFTREELLALLDASR